MKNIKVGKVAHVYGTKGNMAVDIYAFGYRVRWYSNPKFFSVHKVDGWIQVI